MNKKVDQVKVVFAGAGAAGIACANLYLNLGVKRENILFVDTVGVIWEGRTEKMNPYKQRYAVDTKARTLADALKGADVFVGVSAKDLVTPEMLKTMAENPIVFAMANPDPEIPYPLAVATRKDVIMATGRSDYPNQVNNVLGFPFIFRGALDVRAKAINDEMKMAASHALAKLAKEDVPEVVLKAYGVEQHVVRPRVPDSEAVRPARADVGGAGGGQGGVRHGRGPQADHGLGRLPRVARADARAVAQGHALRHAQGPQREDEAARVPRGRARLHHPRRPRHRRSEDRDAGAARQRVGDPRQREAPRHRADRLRDRERAGSEARRGLREDAVRAAPAQGHQHAGGAWTSCTTRPSAAS